MPEPISGEAGPSDKRTDCYQQPEPLPISTAGARRARTFFLETPASEIKTPSEAERHRKADRHEHDEDLLDPVGGMKDGKHRARYLHDSGSADKIGNRDAIDPAIFQFLNERPHAASPSLGRGYVTLLSQMFSPAASLEDCYRIGCRWRRFEKGGKSAPNAATFNTI